MDPISEAVWPYFLALAAALIAYSLFAQKRRSANFAEVAQRQGYQFSITGRDATLKRHENFELFSKGYNQSIRNEMWKTDNGNDIAIFDYNYKQSDGGESRSRNQLVLSIKCRKLDAPAFRLQPEHKLKNLLQSLGYQDINFDSFPIFSQLYDLQGEDEGKVRELFSPEVISFFEANQGMYVEAQQDTLILFIPRLKLSAAGIRKLYSLGNKLLATLI